MISVERTAYPRLNPNKTMSPKNIHAYYTLTEEEKIHIQKTIRRKSYQLSYALQLKTFQNLGYFIDLNQMNKIIIKNF